MDSPQTVEPYRTARGGSQSDLRRHNERIVLSVIDRHPGLFNAELARRTGLAAQTISVILRSLEQRQLLMRGPVLRGRRGQPATPIFLNPLGAGGFGAEIGLRHVRLAGLDFSGTTIGSEIRSHPYPDPDMVVANIVSGVRALSDIAPRMARGGARFLGVATPEGLLDGAHFSRMPHACAAQWAKMDIKSVLEAQLAMPVVLTGSGTAASGAQARERDKDHPLDFAYLHIGQTLLSGVVLDGRVYCGPGGRRPDFGAIAVPDTLGDCVAAHKILSVGGIEKYLLGQGVPISETLVAGETWDWSDAHIIGWTSEAASALSHVAQSIESVLALGAIVIDGVLPSPVMKALVGAARRRLSEAGTSGGDRPALYCGTLGSQAVVLGAARKPLYRTYFSTPSPVGNIN